MSVNNSNSTRVASALDGQQVNESTTVTDGFDVKTLGVVGGGQLGRMMGLAAAPLGISFCFLGDAQSGQPASLIGPVLDQNNHSNLSLFAQSVDVITYESENVDADWLEQLAKDRSIHPNTLALRSSQHRWREKEMFQSLGIETAPFQKVTTEAELEQAVQQLGLPIVVKTTTEGYDGKGQARIHSPDQVAAAWRDLGEVQGDQAELIAEGYVQFKRELSIIAVRSQTGDIHYYPMTENEHADGILRISRMAPDLVPEQTEAKAQAYVQALLQHLDYVGVIALELFDTDQGLLANEMAPRVHNTGHWTQQGAVTCQFSNHVRALCGLPLGETRSIQPYAAMINLIGSLPCKDAILAIPGADLHLYGKMPRVGRKLGHINLVADTEKVLQDRIEQIKSLLKP
jgi:5-(carboxyamino)imidazole ribonucleotide synthase